MLFCFDFDLSIYSAIGFQGEQSVLKMHSGNPTTRARMLLTPARFRLDTTVCAPYVVQNPPPPSRPVTQTVRSRPLARLECTAPVWIIGHRWQTSRTWSVLRNKLTYTQLFFFFLNKCPSPFYFYAWRYNFKHLNLIASTLLDRPNHRVVVVRFEFCIYVI